jgi:cytochrome c553
VTAITNLWTFQVEFEESKYPNPRGTTMEELLLALQKKKQEKNVEELVDMGRGTMEDVLSESAYLQITKYFSTRTMTKRFVAVYVLWWTFCC